jgi:hypothetical protein
MKLKSANIVGTIALQPKHSSDRQFLCRAADDSSLDSLLESLALLPSLACDEPAPVRLVASARLSRFAMDDLAGVTIRADLARLVDDLEVEYDRLAAL